jgi:uncharacterized protein YraI
MANNAAMPRFASGTDKGRRGSGGGKETAMVSDICLKSGGRMLGALLAAAGAVFAAPALAAPAETISDLNMRVGPGTRYPVIITIPRTGAVEVLGCIEALDWCDVAWGSYRGWVSARYLAFFYDREWRPLPQVQRRVGVPIITFRFGIYDSGRDRRDQRYRRDRDWDDRRDREWDREWDRDWSRDRDPGNRDRDGRGRRDGNAAVRRNDGTAPPPAVVTPPRRIAPPARGTAPLPPECANLTPAECAAANREPPLPPVQRPPRRADRSVDPGAAGSDRPAR